MLAGNLLENFCVFLVCCLLSNVTGAQTYENDPEELDGPWNFYWMELYSENPALIEQAPDTAIVHPGRWNGYVLNGQTIEGFGFATYVTYLQVSEQQRAGFRLKGFYSAYNFYVNGVLIGSNGTVGKSGQTSSLQWIPQVLEAVLVPGENTIILEVSNYQHASAGFFHPIKIGEVKKLREELMRDNLIDGFTAGAFMMIGVFFLGMFVTWKRDRNYLIYVVLTLGYAIRILSNGTHIIKGLFPSWPWQLTVGIEYFSFYAVWWSSLALIAFILPRRFYRFFNLAFTILMLAVIVLPLHWYTHALLPSVIIGFSCYLISLGFLIIQRNKFSNRTFLAVLVFLLLALSGWVLEFMIYAKSFDGFLALPNLFRLMAVLSLAFLVSDRYATAYDEVESLKEAAESQKHLIEQQYQQMADQQALLKTRNKEIETLLKEVHHRVKNNLQLITSLLDIEDLYESPQKAAAILEDSKSRVATMSLIHQNLYMNDNLTTISLQEYAEDLLANLEEIHSVSSAPDLSVDCAKYEFDVDTMVPLGLAINELVTNSFKYAPNDKPLFLSISGQQIRQGRYQVTIRDHGDDLPRPFHELVQSGYGLRLAYRLCQQLLGELSHRYEEGNVFTIDFYDSEARRKVE